MGRKPFLLLAALLCAVVLSAVLGFMIHDRATILRDGREVLLKTEPVDPRDLLRGAYVRLNYDITRLPLELFGSQEEIDRALRLPVHVRLEPGADGFWVATAATTEKIPAADGADGVWISGEARYHALFDGATSIEMEYGIERFYAEERVAPEIEANIRARELTEIVVSVAADGRAQIKSLRQGGQTIYTERLY